MLSSEHPLSKCSSYHLLENGTVESKDVPDHNDRSIDRSKSLDRLIDRSISKRRSIITFTKQQKN
jgi:hypothetical protein